jgi:hypothetical protein
MSAIELHSFECLSSTHRNVAANAKDLSSFYQEAPVTYLRMHLQRIGELCMYNNVDRFGRGRTMNGLLGMQ